MGKKVLIVDDEPNIVVSLEFLMKQKGYTVKAVDNGKDALDALREFAPDLVLLDVMMPLLSGYELAQKVRENPAWSQVKTMSVWSYSPVAFRWAISRPIWSSTWVIMP